MNVREPIEACWLYLRLCVGYVYDDVVEVVHAGGMTTITEAVGNRRGGSRTVSAGP